MSKFLSLIEENTPLTPAPEREPDEFTKEWTEQLEGYMAQVELNLGYAGELMVEINDPFVEKRAGELGAKIQEDLHNFMDNFGGTSVEEDAEGDAFDRLEGLYNTDLMKTFIDTYHELVMDIQKEEPFETEDIIEFLAHKMNEFKPLSTEDGEVDMKDMEQVAVALDTANKIKAASDPTRPSRGVRQIDKSIGNIGTAVSMKLNQVAKAIK